LQAFAEQTAKILKDKRVSFVGEPQKTVLTVAGINGGGGSQQEEIAAAFAAGADVFITADFKYHVLRWGAEQGYPLVSAGHYETEIHFIDLMYEILQAKGYRNILFKSQTAQTPWA
jgi:putative NIF3 family GTP cyclohydrolase 1 type 2